MRNDDNITYECMCETLGLQKNNAHETKSTSIFYGGFSDALESRYFEPLMKLFLANHWYIHFAELNLLYYSIVDIIDSLMIPEYIKAINPIVNILLKDILYRSIRNCISDIENLFVEYNYPDIQHDKIELFLSSLISIIKNHHSEHSDVPDGLLSFLINILLLNIHTHTHKLVFVQDNQPLLLINRYFDMYCSYIYV